MADKDTTNDRRGPLSLSRRKMLTAVGAVGAAGVAGCLSGDTDGDDSGGSDKILDEVQDTSIAPQDMNWNYFAENNFPTNTMEYMSEWGAMLFHEDGKLRPWGYKDWSYDKKNNVFTTTLRDDLKKHNGNKYTAEDLWVFDELRRLQSPESSPWKKVELKKNENAIGYHLKKETNPDIYENYRLVRAFWQGKELWQSWLEKYQDAADQKARDQITKKLKKMSISSEDFKKNGYANGVFKLDEVTDKTVTLKPWKEHRLADKINVDAHRIHIATSESRYNQLITNDKADIGRSQFPQKLRSTSEEYLKNLSEYPTLNNIKVLINWRNREYLKDRNFRRAMAAVINTKDVADAAGNGKPVPIHSGIDPSFHDRFLGSSVENYIDYKPGKTDAKLAKQFLKKSGYSVKNGTVVGPDGSKLKPMRFYIGNNKTWQVAGTYAFNQLKKFGFPVEKNKVGRSDKIDTVTNRENMDKWDLSTESHYAGSTIHPYSYFDYRTFWGWRLTEGNFGPSEGAVADLKKWVNNGNKFSPYNGKPIKAEVPVKIGQQELSGKTKTVNIYELFNEIQRPSADKKRQKEIISDLSWAWNFHMPDIDTYLVYGGMWGDTKHWEWTDKKWPYTGTNSAGMYYVTKHGLVKPKKK